MAEVPEIGVLILAGGEATRLPNKLALAAGEVPMIVRVFRNVSPGRRTYVSCKATFPSEIDEHLPCPMVVDRWALRGPLGGMVSAMEEMPTPLVFAVAGDAPFVAAPLIDRLAREWEPGTEAIVPVRARDGREQIEPLAAVYDRLAFVREGLDVVRSGAGGALRLVIDRLRARKVLIEDARIFTNINTPADYAALAESL